MSHLIIAMLALTLVVAGAVRKTESGATAGTPSSNTVRTGRTMSAMADSTGLDTFLVKKYIIENYFRRLPANALSMPWSVLDTIVDQWTAIVSKEQWKKMTDDQLGIARGRIGIVTEVTPHGNLIEKVVHWGPAYRSGLFVGDMIEGADDHTIVGKGHPESNKRIRGVPGTSVLLDVRREDSCLRIVTFRDDFTVPPVTVAVHGRTMGIRITEFDQGLDYAFTRAVRGIDAAGIDTVVFDLRDNPGGSLWEVEALLRHFLADDDTIVTFRSMTNRWADVNSSFFEAPLSDPRVKIIVLQDSGSASASELMAGTLVVRREATIIGTTSYGKGRVQSVVPISQILPQELAATSDIGGVRVTTSTFHPGGTLDIDGVGLKPDLPLAEAQPIRLPSAQTMLRLRVSYDAPDQRIIDSLHAAGYVNMAEAIWAEKGSPFHAIHELSHVRHRITQPIWACAADHTQVPTQFTHKDETQLRRMLHRTMAGQVSDSVLRMEPLERVFEHVHQSTQLLRGAEAALDRVLSAPFRDDLGLDIAVRAGGIYVTSVQPLTSAYHAGVCIGDRIMSIAGRAIAVNHAEATYQLMTVRERDGRVSLEIRRGRRQFTLTLFDAQRNISDVHTHVEGGLAYIDMKHAGSTAQASTTLRLSIDRVLDADAFDVVVDLRGAGGDNVEVAARMLELFAKEGDTVMSVYRKGILDRVFIARHPGSYRGLRMHLMVDSSTRDAMEAFAGAMQRNGYARIIGMATAARTAEVRRTHLASGAILRTSEQYVANPSPASAFAVESMPVYPDRVIAWPTTPLESIQAVTTDLRDVLSWRTLSPMPTEEIISAFRTKHPSTRRHLDSAPIAEAIWGDRGRLYNLMPLLAQVTGYK
jgi:carboxyl-terminal processing protease